MKTIFLLMLCVLMALTASAQQEVDVYENGSLSAKYINKTGNTVKVVFKEYEDPYLLKGDFSVSYTKKVKFTNGNLYWDGTNSAWKFEENQTDYTADVTNNTRSTTHQSYFFWSKTASVMYAASYSDDSRTTSDAFFFCEANKNNDANKVDGNSGYYALTKDEWDYLIKNRTNASSLIKYGVTVTNGSNTYNNCLIIAPDNFSGTLVSSYTLSELNSAGLVCLPAAGCWYGSSFYGVGSDGSYWAATPGSGYAGYAYCLYFGSSFVGTGYSNRGYARSVRLVY